MQRLEREGRKDLNFEKGISNALGMCVGRILNRMRTRSWKLTNSMKESAKEQRTASSGNAPRPELLSTPEAARIRDADAAKLHWRRWGPYVSERAWATVREDYSPDGNAWAHLPFDQANGRAYRVSNQFLALRYKISNKNALYWGEDGIAGICDNHQRLCFSLAFWNTNDSIIKERLFGVSGPEGNHGEDVKELYYYLDNTPTHSYQKFLYKYPHAAFPYEQLVAENAKRSRTDPEFELIDTGVFDNDRYFDIFVEYCKHARNVNDNLIKITIHNRGPESAPIHVLPQLWFRNTWSWKTTDFGTHSCLEDEDGACEEIHENISHAKRTSKDMLPDIKIIRGDSRVQNTRVLEAVSDNLHMFLHYDLSEDETGEKFEGEDPTVLFTENETNFSKLYNVPNKSKYCKDGINERVVNNDLNSVCPNHGTKAAVWYKSIIPAGKNITLRLRLTSEGFQHADSGDSGSFGSPFAAIFRARKSEADQFYNSILSSEISEDMKNVQRQAFAGMLWSKQFYNFVIKDWLDGDVGQVKPPPERKNGRNREWRHLHVDDILSMPDKWEYPFFASWDSAFHSVVFAQIDPWFAKKQLLLLTREWYMNPNGQIPAYEWNFSDVNPPVHAWAAIRVYKLEKKLYGREDRLFLERIFQKLLLNFTWWVNRKDADGLNVFNGGFLGLDNIAVFNRSEALPTGGRLRQADATGWMAFYCLSMLEIALELAPTNRSYEDIASKFFEHFLYISEALSFSSENGVNSSLWNEEDGFYYDNLVFSDSSVVPLKVRSLVGLIPLFAVLVLEPSVIDKCPDFKRRMNWFFENFDFSRRNVAKLDDPSKGQRILLALVPKDRLIRILNHMLDENEFLSPYGIRSLSKFHKDTPYIYYVGNQAHRVDFLPGESNSGLFGGNSNWRGPIWLATTYLLIESLQRFYHYYGDGFKVAVPSNAQKNELMTLKRIGDEIMHRNMRIFLRAKDGGRAVNGGDSKLNTDPYFKDLVLFYEYFHSENGKGLGASHQTGWTGLVARMIDKAGVDCEEYGHCW
ncbi:hypothetical protein HK100_000495 [Physocladia obscura]|uniref:Mannosylglycerate hydrolase MGH1-like glycoside hydrolase domain-containing protein n=1 Tax=Physocladia obscura TaxID=109957 RepID=A0AAD5TAR1_9FUNG|nr:hypothetical protein HK100_000495 [Physocladia obscura]